MREITPKAFKVIDDDRVEIYDNAECHGEPDVVLPVWVINQIASAVVIKYNRLPVRCEFSQ